MACDRAEASVDSLCQIRIGWGRRLKYFREKVSNINIVDVPAYGGC